MKLCLLYLSALTLLQLHSISVTSAENGKLPSIDLLSFVISLCEREVALENDNLLTPIPIVIQPNSGKFKNVKINSNLDINLSRSVVSISQSFAVGKKQALQRDADLDESASPYNKNKQEETIEPRSVVDINIGHKNVQNFNNDPGNKLIVQKRSSSKGSDKKRKYMAIAKCVRLRIK